MVMRSLETMTVGVFLGLAVGCDVTTEPRSYEVECVDEYPVDEYLVGEGDGDGGGCHCSVDVSGHDGRFSRCGSNQGDCSDRQCGYLDKGKAGDCGWAYSGAYCGCESSLLLCIDTPPYYLEIFIFTPASEKSEQQCTDEFKSPLHRFVEGDEPEEGWHLAQCTP